MKSTTLSPNKQRWLVETLYGVRGHFGPVDSDPEIAEGVIRTCIDRRLHKEIVPALVHGNFFVETDAGAPIPPQSSDNLSLQTGIAHPILGAGGRTIIELGHEDCKAIGVEKGAIISPDAYKGPMAEWMIQNASGDLKQALIQAHEYGKDPKKILKHLERTTALSSMRELQNYALYGTPVSQLLDDDRIHLITAVSGLEKVNGNYALPVFDPFSQTYRPVENLYKELFGGDTDYSVARIESEHAKLGRREGVYAKSTHLGAELHTKALDKGITRLIEDIARPASR